MPERLVWIVCPKCHQQSGIRLPVTVDPIPRQLRVRSLRPRLDRAQTPALSPMPWKCPACSTPIRQQLTAAGDDAPRPGRIYCCAVCRLDLTIDGDHMTVAPIPPEPADTADDRPPRKRRTR